MKNYETESYYSHNWQSDRDTSPADERHRFHVHSLGHPDSTPTVVLGIDAYVGQDGIRAGLTIADARAVAEQLTLAAGEAERQVEQRQRRLGAAAHAAIFGALADEDHGPQPSHFGPTGMQGVQQ